MAAITTAAIGATTAAYTIYNSEKQRKEAKRDMNNYERQDLDNAFEDMPISFEGLDYLRDESARTTASMVDAARNSGSRGVIGSVPKIVGANNALNANVARYIDEQFNRRNQLIAEDNARIEGMTENRDMNNVNALSSQIQAGRQGVRDGIFGIGSSMAYLGRNYPGNNNTTPTATSQPNASPMPYDVPQDAPYFDFANSWK